MRMDKRKLRWSPASLPVFITLVTVAYPARFLTLPSGFNCKLETLPLGLAKCGVLERLYASARNCTVTRSFTRNTRCSAKSTFTRSEEHTSELQSHSFISYAV